MSTVWLALLVSLSLTIACGKAKVEEKKSEDTATADQNSNKSDAANSTAANPASKPAEVTPPAAPAPKLLELYPPVFGIFPLTEPEAGKSLYFGFSSDGSQTFQMMWIYAVIASPNFDAAEKLPDLSTEAAQEAFLSKWAAEFAARPDHVASLNKLAAEFSFKVDPNYMNDASATIPASALSSIPVWAQATQKYFARRYTTKAPGTTSITATIDGVAVQYPVTIKAYTTAQLTQGKARYEAPTEGCVSCHGSASTNKTAFLKHSSDYLAFASDAEILNIVKNASYPDASLLNDGAHKWTLASPQVENDLVGYLRSFPPYFDKLQPALPALR